MTEKKGKRKKRDGSNNFIDMETNNSIKYIAGQTFIEENGFRGTVLERR